MKLSTFLTYYEAIEVVSASETMTQLGVSDYPHMSANNRKKYFDQFKKSTKPIRNEKKVNLDDISKMMGAI